MTTLPTDGDGNTPAPLFAWRAAIVASTLASTARHVALTLSLHMDGDGGSCWPSVPTIAAETGLREETVRRHLAGLVAGGWLDRRERPGRTPMWTAAVPADAPESTPRPAESDPDPSRQTLPLAPNATPRVSRVDPSRLTRVTPRAKREGSTSRGLQEDVSKTPRPLVLVSEDAAPDIDALFAAWYAEYPRKVGRPNALRAFRAHAIAAGVDAVTAGLARWVEHWRAEGTEQRFIPHPATWLNQHRWDDPPPAPRRRGSEREQRNAEARRRAVEAATRERPGMTDLFGIPARTGAIEAAVVGS